MKVLKLDEFVQEFGTEKQKKAFEKVKLNSKGLRNIQPKTFDLLIKVAETQYETVRVDGKGANRLITLDNKFKMIKEKVDKRGKHGNQTGNTDFKVEYAKENRLLAKICVQARQLQKDEQVAQSTPAWLEFTEMITQDERSLMGCKYNPEKTKKAIEHLVSIGTFPNETYAPYIKEYNNKVLDPMRSVFIIALKKLAKAGIVEWNIAHFLAVEQVGKPGLAHVVVSSKEYARFEEKRLKLLEKHGLKSTDVYIRSYSKKVAAFKKEWRQIIKTIPYVGRVNGENGNIGDVHDHDGTSESTGVVYFYKGISITVIVTEKEMNKYISSLGIDPKTLKGFNIKMTDYSKLLDKHIYNQALEREINGHKRISEKIAHIIKENSQKTEADAFNEAINSLSLNEDELEIEMIEECPLEEINPKYIENQKYARKYAQQMYINRQGLQSGYLTTAIN